MNACRYTPFVLGVWACCCSRARNCMPPVAPRICCNTRQGMIPVILASYVSTHIETVEQNILFFYRTTGLDFSLVTIYAHIKHEGTCAPNYVPGRYCPDEVCYLPQQIRHEISPTLHTSLNGLHFYNLATVY